MIEKIKKITLAKTVGIGTSGAITGVVTTFGTASTGTAISTLHGAALYNATMYAIGGSVFAGSLMIGGVAIVSGATAVWGYNKYKNNKKDKK